MATYTWKKRPNLDPNKWTISAPKTRGGKWTAVRRMPTDGLPANAPDWAREQMGAITKDQQQHQGYITGSVMPWQSATLNQLNTFNTGANDSYLNALRSAMGGATAAGQAQLPGVGATTGGLVYSPTQYRGNASAQAAAGLGVTTNLLGENQAALQKMMPGTISQGLVSRLGQYAAGLPEVYNKRRSEERTRLSAYLIEQAEDKRRFGLEMAQRSYRDMLDSVLGFGQLGLEQAKLAMPEAPSGVDPNTPPPPGYVVQPQADGSVKWVRDPSYSKPGGGGKAGGLTPEQERLFRKQAQDFAMTLWQGKKKYGKGAADEDIVLGWERKPFARNERGVAGVVERVMARVGNERITAEVVAAMVGANLWRRYLKYEKNRAKARARAKSRGR